MPKYSSDDTMFLERSVMSHRRPTTIRVIVWLITLFIFSLLGWSFVAKVPEVARTRGQVVPRGDVILVQSLEGGLIVDLLVKEGETVEKDQPLARFEPLKTETDVNQLTSRIVYLELEAERLKAFVDEREADFTPYRARHPLFVDQQEQLLTAQRAELNANLGALHEQLLQKRQSLRALDKKLPVLKGQLDSSNEIVTMYENLIKENVATRLELLNAQQRRSEFQKELEELYGMRSVLEQEIKEIRERKKSTRQNTISDAQNKRANILSELSEIRQRLNERQTSLDRLLIISPAKGIIKSLPFSIRGAVVNPSEVLAEIVPVNVDLVVEIQVSPRDIGFIHAGQAVTIRVDTYDYSRFGTLQGSLTKISPTTFTGPNGELFYKGEVTPVRNFLGADSTKNALLPGMTAEVDIITGEKTIFQYLLKPVFTLAHEGFTER